MPVWTAQALLDGRGLAAVSGRRSDHTARVPWVATIRCPFVPWSLRPNGLATVRRSTDAHITAGWQAQSRWRPCIVGDRRGAFLPPYPFEAARCAASWAAWVAFDFPITAVYGRSVTAPKPRDADEGFVRASICKNPGLTAGPAAAATSWPSAIADYAWPAPARRHIRCPSLRAPADSFTRRKTGREPQHTSFVSQDSLLTR